LSELRNLHPGPQCDNARSNAEIAKELYISPHTARRHTERIMQKVGIHSRAEIVAKLYY
jgi:DNA-binding CsgD family transcriptional regulator